MRRFITRILSVGGLTLVSRVVGFVRDVMMAAVLGAGPIADAFVVALRLPNHFRAIFGEGAFNAAFVPAYARILEQNGKASASIFADRVFTLLFVVLALLLVLALVFTGGLISLLAPGFVGDPVRFPVAVELTRITFPYLLLITIVTLYGGILNALHRFAAAAAAPILLNVSIVVALSLAVFFPTAGHAAAWGVLAAGVFQFLLLAADARRAEALPVFRRPRFDADVRQFFKALGPAIVGSAGLQIAVFADTILATLLPAGSVAALYYADRLNQLPIGVIGIAAGTVLLPEMARRIAAGDEPGARHAQNRAIELTLLLAMPAFVAFLLVPDLIMRGLFARGAFGAAEAALAGAVLAAYAVGLLPFVLIRSVVATFYARGDTRTPVIAALTAVAVNVALKIVLVTPFGVVGLALATAAGGWINFGIVLVLAARRGHFEADADLRATVLKLAIAGTALGLVLWFGTPHALLVAPGVLVDEVALAVMMGAGFVVYGGIVAALLGPRWFRALARMRAEAKAARAKGGAVPPTGPAAD